MSAIQQYLFADESTSLSVPQRNVAAFRNDETAELEFARAIGARLAGAGPAGLILAGCSPAVCQETLMSDVLRVVHNLEPGVAHTVPGVMQLPAPPNTIGLPEQLRVLHGRYRARRALKESTALELSGKALAVEYSTETEAVIDLLREREIRLVCITRGENLFSATARLEIPPRMLLHLSDIARRAAVPHVVLGHRMPILRAAQAASIHLPLQVVLQRLYDPDDEKQRGEFASILAFCDKELGKNCEVSLARMTKALMSAVGGDPCRATRWVSDAVCGAAGAHRSMVRWDDFITASGRATEGAEADLAAYRSWLKPADLDIKPIWK
jgi:hypothetical protein